MKKITDRTKFIVGDIIFSKIDPDEMGYLKKISDYSLYFQFEDYEELQMLSRSFLKEKEYYLVDRDKNPEYFL